MSNDLAPPNPSRASSTTLAIPTHRRETAWLIADTFAREAITEIARAQELSGAGDGFSAPQMRTSTSKEIEHRLKCARGARRAAIEAWNAAMISAKFAMQVDAPRGPRPAETDDEPLDPATQALMDDAQRRVEDQMKKGRTMIDATQIPPAAPKVSAEEPAPLEAQP